MATAAEVLVEDLVRRGRGLGHGHGHVHVRRGRGLGLGLGHVRCERSLGHSRVRRGATSATASPAVNAALAGLATAAFVLTEVLPTSGSWSLAPKHFARLWALVF